MTKKQVRTLIIFPMCLLVLNAFEDVCMWKVKQVFTENAWSPFLMVGLGLVLYGIAFAIVGSFLAPWTSRVLEKGHVVSKKNAGATGVLIFFGLAFIALYWAYYMIMIHGESSLLPLSWR